MRSNSVAIRRFLVAALLALARSALILAAPTTAPAPESAPADEIRKEGATYLDESFDAYEGLRKLQALAAAADWSAATDAARSLTQRFGDRVYRDGPNRFISIRRRVAELVAAWPADGLAAYVRRMNPPALAQLDDARADCDIDALLKVADDYFPTPAAADAVELACAIALESGDFDFARQWLNTLIETHPLRTQRRESWLAFRAIAAAWAGNPSALPAPNSQNQPASPARWAGREVDLAAILREARPTAATQPVAHDPNNTYYVSSRRQNCRPAAARAEAVIWRFDRFGPNTLAEPAANESANADAPSPQARALAGGRLLAMQPVVEHGLVIVHDHRSVFAIDPTHTEQPAWRFDLVESKDDAQPWNSDDEPPPQFTTTIAGNRVYAPLERRPPDRYGSDPANPGASVLVCLELDSGRPIWSADLATWRSEFEEARIDSAPIVVRDRVLAVVRRRKAFGFEACYLLGFDAADGRIVYATHLGEAAIGGYGYRRATITHAAHSGDRAFVQTNLGTIAAVSTGSGELRWIFQYPPAASDAANPPGPGRHGQQAHAWQSSPPIIWRNQLVAAPLDAEDLIVLDQDSGAPIHSVTMDELRKPDALVGIIENRLYLAGEFVVCYDLAENRVAWERQLTDGDLHGAPAISTDGLMIPTALALLRFPLDGGAPRAFAWDLANAGNVLIAPASTLARNTAATTQPDAWPDQVIIAAPGAIYALASKEDAFARMQAALAAHPADPAAALALADLCLRTREFDRGIAALDTALDRAGGLARITDPGLRRRLFDACMGFADAIAAASREDRAASRPAGDLAIPLLRRAGQISLEPLDQVAFRVRLARILEADNLPAEAAVTWQQILSDPSLRAIHVPPSLLESRPDSADEILESPRAAEIARAALDHLIAEHGAKVYATIEADAEQRLAVASEARDAPALLRIADAFPNGAVAPRALLRRADLLESQGNLDDAAASLRRALVAGIAVDRPKAMLQLARILRNARRSDEAAQWIDRVERESPDYLPAMDGRKISLAEFRANLLPDWTRRDLRPAPGTTLHLAYTHEYPEVPLILSPRFADLPETSFDDAYIYVDDAIECRIARTGEPRWPNPCPCRITPAFLGMDATNAVFATRHQVLAVDRDTGALNWKLGEYPADADAPGVDPESIAAWSHHAMTPDRLYSANDRGELVATALGDGAVQWRIPTTQRVAAELVADDQIVAYVARQVRSSLVILRRADNGGELAAINIPDERAVQSLALAPPGILLALTARELFAFRAADAQPLWRAPLRSRAVPGSLQCDSGIVAVLSDDGRIFAIDLADGRLAWVGEPLPAPPATPPWTDAADGILYAAARNLLVALDLADGRRLWTVQAGLPLDPSSNEAPQLLRDQIMIITTEPVPAQPGEQPVRRSRRQRRRPEENYRANFFPFAAPPRAEPPPHDQLELGILNQFRAAIPFNNAMLIVDGHSLIGYAPAGQSKPTTQPPSQPRPTTKP